MTRPGDGERVLITGATGLVGGDVLERVLRDDPRAQAYVLLRESASWQRVQWRLGSLAARVTPVQGDITAAGLGMTPTDRQQCLRDTTVIVHCAADTKFSQSLARARAVNLVGTRHTLAFAGECPLLRSYVHVSTAFVAGRMTGVIPERPLVGVPGWVNAYEQSKHEAEAAVRNSDVPWVIARPSTIVCDDVGGSVRQVNAVHRALRLYRAGLASMVPGQEQTLVDVVTAEYVARGVAILAVQPGLAGRTFHLCAGAGALPLGELLDVAHRHWRRDARWRRRGVARPALTSLDTYRVFENAVAETGDARLRTITRSLTHFVPQLALPKQFDTAGADKIVGAAPVVRDYWDRMLAGLRLAGVARRQT